jgi:hypothetical protein
VVSIDVRRDLDARATAESAGPLTGGLQVRILPEEPNKGFRAASKACTSLERIMTDDMGKRTKAWRQSNPFVRRRTAKGMSHQEAADALGVDTAKFMDWGVRRAGAYCARVVRNPRSSASRRTIGSAG